MNIQQNILTNPACTLLITQSHMQQRQSVVYFTQLSPNMFLLLLFFSSILSIAVCFVYLQFFFFLSSHIDFLFLLRAVSVTGDMASQNCHMFCNSSDTQVVITAQDSSGASRMLSAEHRQILNVQPAPLTLCTRTDTQPNDVRICVITARQAKGQVGLHY